MTRFSVQLPWLGLPGLVTTWTEKKGLTIALLRILYYLGSCFMSNGLVKGAEEKILMALEYEFLHALVCALHYDWRDGIVWELSESCVQFLELNSAVLNIPTPNGLKISVKAMAATQRIVMSLPGEHLLERLDYPSQTRVRWANHDKQ